jgi:5-methylcytosine-specific restriction endonuclease McrA
MSQRRRLTKLERVLLFRREDGFCGICGEPVPFQGFHADHVKPFRLTGRTVRAELQPACPRCNLIKGAKYAENI